MCPLVCETSFPWVAFTHGSPWPWVVLAHGIPHPMGPIICWSPRHGSSHPWILLFVGHSHLWDPLACGPRSPMGAPTHGLAVGVLWLGVQAGPW